MNTTISETIQPAAFPTSLTREHRYASREDGIAGDLTIGKEDTGSEMRPRLTGRTKVRWSVRHARGWGKTYFATFATEELARAFAATKWEQVKAWIARQPANEEACGAAEQFSAMVATMTR